MVCKTLKPLSPTTACFRCLASDHFVQDCRDPVRCRCCRQSGHRSPECKMPFSRLFRASTRRLPTVRTPTTSHSVRAVPFSPSSAPPASSTPPSPPPSSPELAPPSPNSAPTLEFTFPPTTAYDPANMVASSSVGPAMEVLSTQSLRPLMLPSSVPAAMPLPQFVGKFIIGCGGGVAARGAAVIASGPPSPAHCSVPPSPSPPCFGLPPAPPSDNDEPHGKPLFLGRGVDVGIDAF